VRVVLDTNILISACWTPGGLESQTVQMALAGTITACVSPAVWAEYQDVLFRDKFASMRVRAEELLAKLEASAVQVEPGDTVSAAADEDDNRFLECAAAAGAAYLITGNLKHYPAVWGLTEIVNARGFLTSSPE
jgi:putative PIN family toxin of toxin-antitoxin system